VVVTPEIGPDEIRWPDEQDIRFLRPGDWSMTTPIYEEYLKKLKKRGRLQEAVDTYSLAAPNVLKVEEPESKYAKDLTPLVNAVRSRAQALGLWPKKKLQEANPYHEPAGSPVGGRFARSPSGRSLTVYHGTPVDYEKLEGERGVWVST